MAQMSTIEIHKDIRRLAGLAGKVRQMRTSSSCFFGMAQTSAISMIWGAHYNTSITQMEADGKNTEGFGYARTSLKKGISTSTLCYRR